MSCLPSAAYTSASSDELYPITVYIQNAYGLVYTTFDEDIVINNCPFCGEKLEWQIMNVNII